MNKTSTQVKELRQRYFSEFEEDYEYMIFTGKTPWRMQMSVFVNTPDYVGKDRRVEDLGSGCHRKATFSNFFGVGTPRQSDNP